MRSSDLSPAQKSAVHNNKPNGRPAALPPNPFSPSFGISPPVLAGRRNILSSFDTVFDSVRSQSYATLLWGLRGVGKTVLLNVLEDRASTQGWAVVSAAAAKRSGLVGQITLKAVRCLTALREEHDVAPPRRFVSSVSIMGSGISTEQVSTSDVVTRAARDALDLETVLAELGDFLAERGAGLLVTIDELHVSGLDEIREFGNVFQLASRRAERPIAFVGAALPDLEHRLLSGESSTFLQRCYRHEIGNLRPSEAATALRRPIELSGGRIDVDALQIAVEASNGQPYLVQLIGAYAWDEAENPVGGITVGDVQRAVSDAVGQFGEHVHGPVWHRLSPLDKKFLTAMLADADISAVGDVGGRWGHGPRSLSTYRKRLLAAGLIVPRGRGRVAFADAALRRYVQSQAVLEGWTDDMSLPPS